MSKTHISKLYRWIPDLITNVRYSSSNHSGLHDCMVLSFTEKSLFVTDIPFKSTHKISLHEVKEQSVTGEILMGEEV